MADQGLKLGGGLKHFFSVAFYNFQQSGGTEDPTTPPPLRSLVTPNYVIDNPFFQLWPTEDSFHVLFTCMLLGIITFIYHTDFISNSVANRSFSNKSNKFFAEKC